jgi:hypothetical protein
MEAHAGVSPDIGRFSSLLAAGSCPRPLYDEVLFETHGCVVTPTLGSILPKWLLVIPRKPVINFALWQAACGVSPYAPVQTILAKHGIADNRAIWFEHGPSEAGSSLGCGVDQAHLHIVVDAPFSFQDFISRAMAASQIKWQSTSAYAAHSSVGLEQSYLIAASADRAAVANNVESVGSQFFRRVIADLVQQADAWNYRTHPHFANVRETIRTFRT